MLPKITQNPKILISRGDALGDVILATALIKPIKAQFSKAEIYFLIKEAYIPLLSNIKEINGFIVDTLPPKNIIRNFGQIFTLKKELKKYKFDIFLGLWEKRRFSILAFLAKIKIRVGYSNNLTNILLYNFRIKPRFQDYFLHQAAHNLAFLKVFGIAEIKPEIYLVKNESIIQELEKKFSFLTKNYAVVHIDPSRPHKMIDKNILSKVCGNLGQKFDYVILFGHEKENNYVKFLKEKASNENLISLVNQLSLIETLNLISGSQFYLGPDSGPAHIAAAFKVKSLIYFLNKNQIPARWGLLGTEHLILKPQIDCEKVCRSTECQDDKCLKALKATDFSNAIETLMIEKDLNSKNPQKYWLQKTLNIGFFDNNEALAQKFNKLAIPNYYLGPKFTWFNFISILKKLMKHNINFLVIDKKNIPLKFKILTLIASNFLTCYPKIITIKNLDSIL